MLEKVILICSELWRLKSLHFSEHRTGEEEKTVDKMAAFIAEIHLIQAGQIEHLKKESSDKYTNIFTQISKDHFNKMELLLKINGRNRRHFKHTLDFILSDFFKNNPDIEKIKLKDFKYDKSIKKRNRKQKLRSHPDNYGGNF